jgi:molybdopterin-containing oxidoreductase family iron-sulfur binding subunit
MLSARDRFSAGSGRINRLKGLFQEHFIEMNRRTFLKTAGLGSIAFAAGCSPEAEKRLHALVRAPDDGVPGQPTWYATTCRECPAGCGVLAANREGRVVKLEGNPLHPVNRGALCARGQAALQGLYHPDRATSPRLRVAGGWRGITFGEAQALLCHKAGAADCPGRAPIALVTGCVGQSLLDLMTRAMAALDSPAPFVYEPLALDALGEANRRMFGVDGLVGYRMEAADRIVSLGADFLDTWLSPVEYARRFKQGHAITDGAKGMLVQVSPHQNVTGANADRWIPCRPGGEAAIALGLIHAWTRGEKGAGLPAEVPDALQRAAGDWTRERVVQVAGIRPEDFDLLIRSLAGARRPLVLGCGAGAPNEATTHGAVNLLQRLLDPELARIDTARRHRLGQAGAGGALHRHLARLAEGRPSVLLLNQVNPVHNLPGAGRLIEDLRRRGTFVVSFTTAIDDTAGSADLIFPLAHPLESWDEYGGWIGLVSSMQPAMGPVHPDPAPALGDVLLSLAYGPRRPVADYRQWLARSLMHRAGLRHETDYAAMLQHGGRFDVPGESRPPAGVLPLVDAARNLADMPPPAPPPSPPVVVAAPSIRFYDGRGADHPWLLELPDPLTQVTWQTPVAVHPQTADHLGLAHGADCRIRAADAQIVATAYLTEAVAPDVLMIGAGQGHEAGGRYARQRGPNPFALLTIEQPGDRAVLSLAAGPVQVAATGDRSPLAHTDGSRVPHDRKIALSVPLEQLRQPPAAETPGLTMHDFPLTLPLPEDYDPRRDIYSPHDHAGYRWGMVVDLDRCIGCGACAVACAAENNVAVVGEDRVLEGREMAWLRIERYLDPADPTRVSFLPMMCQHCDNAPCEAVCPVYAPHHGREGLNNQVYNRCIGTRFCAQNCPYKVRRFNWFNYTMPAPLPLQYNPDVTVRAKGVMEKCSFCVQRIKAAHNVAKNEGRPIGDGEITPACVQTCPTGALVFGDLMDPGSRARRLCEDRRAYQVMGYLNTKPAVIYLKKVVQDV